MSKPHPVGTTIFWLSLLFLLAASVTYAVFAVFVPGPERGLTFYAAFSVVVAAELGFFSHMVHSRLAQAGVPTATRTVRIQVQALIFIWFLLAVATAIVATRPAYADTLKADKILAIYLIVTFVFFASAYFLYAKDIEIGRIDGQLIAQRRRLQLAAPDVENVMQAVEKLGRQRPEHAEIADRVHKKLDTVRSALDAALVSQRSLDAPGDELRNLDAQIERQVATLATLSERASTAAPDRVRSALDELANESDAVIAALRRRERLLLS